MHIFGGSGVNLPAIRWEKIRFIRRIFAPFTVLSEFWLFRKIMIIIPQPIDIVPKMWYTYNDIL